MKGRTGSPSVGVEAIRPEFGLGVEVNGSSLKTSDRQRELVRRNRERYAAAGLCRCSRLKTPGLNSCRGCRMADKRRKIRNGKD